MTNYEKRITIFDILNILILTLLGVVTLYPFLNVLAVSLNDSMDTIKGGITIYPRVFTFENYKVILKVEELKIGVIISVLRTLIGTITGVLSTAMIAFVISRKDFILRRPITVLFVITMYVGGGLIPEYMLIRNVGLMNSFGVYIFPPLIFAFNMIVMRAFIEDIPIELQESATIDGASDLIVFVRIILPLCLPVIAVISLFIAVFQWNSWFDTMIYAAGEPNLTTLQYELQKILQNAQIQGQDMYNSDPSKFMKVTPESIRMAMTIVATVPILVVYPFVQKYFVTGLTLGAVKS